MEMLLEIRDEDAVEGYISEALAAKRRIMGFGHRVYKTIDPRAVHLRDMVCTLDEEAENAHWCHLSMRVNEVVEAKKKGMVTIALCGAGGKMKDVADVAICVPSTDTPRIQESHITIGHILCDIVEKELFG